MEKILSTGRTSLKVIEKSDYEEIYNWIINFDYNMLWSNIREFPRKENFFDLLDYNIKNEFTYYFLIQNVKKESIGTIFIHDYNKVDNYASISAFIKPNFQNKFYGVDSYKLIFNFIYQNLPIRKLYFDVFEYNLSSIKLIEKVGFNLEGTFVKHRYLNGSYHNIIRYSLFLEDWKTLKQKF